MFSEEKFGNQSILNKIKNLIPENSNKIIVNKLDELTLIIDSVKITFFHYPYKITYPVSFGYRIKIPDLLTLSTMKAFALGHRAKWKDYVDLYFILKGGLSVSQISQKGREIFSGEFNEKLFRSQLSYFDEINYEETIEFMPGFEVSNDIIKNQLIEFSLS